MLACRKGRSAALGCAPAGLWSDTASRFLGAGGSHLRPGPIAGLKTVSAVARRSDALERTGGARPGGVALRPGIRRAGHGTVHVERRQGPDSELTRSQPRPGGLAPGRSQQTRQGHPAGGKPGVGRRRPVPPAPHPRLHRPTCLSRSLDVRLRPRPAIGRRRREQNIHSSAKLGFRRDKELPDVPYARRPTVEVAKPVLLSREAKDLLADVRR